MVKDPEITRARDLIEESLVNMVSKLISDGDKANKKPIELGIESLKSFATCYE